MLLEKSSWLSPLIPGNAKKSQVRGDTCIPVGGERGAYARRVQLHHLGSCWSSRVIAMNESTCLNVLCFWFVFDHR